MSTRVVAEPTTEQLDAAVTTLKLLADHNRLRILWALLRGEHSVGELAEHVDSAPSAVSQHLAKLRLARLVSTRRHGNRIYYAAEDEHILRLVSEALFHGEHATTSEPAHHAAERTSTGS